VLVLGGLDGNHAVQCSIWVRAKHLLKDRDKLRKILIEFVGRRTFRMHSNL
jgi:hypothetical protein